MSRADPRSPEPKSGAVEDERETQLEVAEEDSFPASDLPSITDPGQDDREDAG